MKHKINKKHLPMILIILDGWGLSKNYKGNAIKQADTPVIDSLFKKYPFVKLQASGKNVGLPDNQEGNSEAGHMNIGAGRIIEQDAVEICKNINQGTFFKNPAFVEALHHVKKNNSKLHLMGMLSNGMSAHSDPDHLLALLSLARKSGVKDVYLHLFTDGRDSPRFTAIKLIGELQKTFKNGEKIATIMGRFFAMDRTGKWDRTKKAYEAMVLGKGQYAKNAVDAITQSYNKEESDEFVKPYIISPSKERANLINDNDSVIFFNLRSDRARQLARAFIQKDFNKKNPEAFQRRKVVKNLKFIAMTDFGPGLSEALCAFPGADLSNTLPMALPGIRQLYIAETEKYAHVTYFFNGGYDHKVNGEDYYKVASPNVVSYADVPAMSSAKLSDKIVDSLRSDKKDKKYDFTVVNFAAPDMIGHTGEMKAAIECCEAIDKEISRLVREYNKRKGTVIITADHGNVEEMIDVDTGEIKTEHTTNPVPFVIINNTLKNKIKLKKGVLADIAPTILDLLEIKKPKEMSRKSLIK